MSRSDVESLYAYTHCGIDVSKVTDIYIYIYIYIYRVYVDSQSRSTRVSE